MNRAGRLAAILSDLANNSPGQPVRTTSPHSLFWCGDGRRSWSAEWISG